MIMIVAAAGIHTAFASSGTRFLSQLQGHHACCARRQLSARGAGGRSWGVQLRGWRGAGAHCGVWLSWKTSIARDTSLFTLQPQHGDARVGPPAKRGPAILFRCGTKDRTAAARWRAPAGKRACAVLGGSSCPGPGPLAPGARGGAPVWYQVRGAGQAAVRGHGLEGTPPFGRRPYGCTLTAAGLGS